MWNRTSWSWHGWSNNWETENDRSRGNQWSNNWETANDRSRGNQWSSSHIRDDQSDRASTTVSWNDVRPNDGNVLTWDEDFESADIFEARFMAEVPGYDPIGWSEWQAQSWTPPGQQAEASAPAVAEAQPQVKPPAPAPPQPAPMEKKPPPPPPPQTSATAVAVAKTRPHEKQPPPPMPNTAPMEKKPAPPPPKRTLPAVAEEELPQLKAPPSPPQIGPETNERSSTITIHSIRMPLVKLGPQELRAPPPQIGD